jgi:hypothetical protein
MGTLGGEAIAAPREPLDIPKREAPYFFSQATQVPITLIVTSESAD